MNHLDRILPLRAKAEAYAAKILKSREDAADAVQNAYIKVARQKSIAPASLTNYWYTCVRNECFEILRTRQRQVPTVGLLEGVNTAAPALDLPALNLAALKPADQVLVTQLVNHCGSKKAVADSLGLKPSVLRCRLARLRKRAHRLKVLS